MRSSHIFYNLVTGTALLIYNETAYPLAGPFKLREDAEAAANNLIRQLKSADSDRPEEKGSRPDGGSMPF